MAVKPIPDGYHSATPYLIVDDAAKALDFYKKALGARELFRMAMPNGRVGHAEMQIGNSRIMLGDEHPEMGAKSAKALGGSPIGICLYVEDADAWFDRAVTAGATVVYPLKDQFYGDRSGTVADPFGLKWTIATHKEDVPHDELCRRAEAAMKSGACA
jgi:PhnB protein